MTLKQRKPVEHANTAAMKEYYAKLAKRPPTTELQKLAQKENFALFQLASMLGHLCHIRNCPTVLLKDLYKLEEAIGVIKNHIKQEQSNRRSIREE